VAGLSFPLGTVASALRPRQVFRSDTRWTDEDSVISRIGKEFPRFSQFFRYQANRRHAQGDTFCLSNELGDDMQRLSPIFILHVLYCIEPAMPL